MTVRSGFDERCAGLKLFSVDWKTYLADVPEYEPARRTELKATDKMFETDKMSAVSDLTDITLNVKGNNVLRNGQKYYFNDGKSIGGIGQSRVENESRSTTFGYTYRFLLPFIISI